MKILIAGSLPSDGSAELFKIICSDIADEITRRKAAVVLGSDRPETADYHIFKRLKEKTSESHIKFFYHEDKGPPFLKEVGALSIEYERVTGGWDAGRIPQIVESDLIITIGGSDKTRILGLIASYLRKPLIPVFPSGGASSILWDRVRPLYEGNAPASRLVNQIETWSGSSSAAAVLDLGAQSTRLLKNGSTPKLVFTYGLVLAFIAVWLGVFYMGVSVPQLSLYVLTMAACALGSFVPVLVEALSTPDWRLPWNALLLRPASAFLMAFVLYVTYMFSGFVVNGDLKFFNSLHIENDFRRVALVLSVIGLSSGVLIDSHLKSISSRGIGLQG